jgi:hypothetical protein
MKQAERKDWESIIVIFGFRYLSLELAARRGGVFRFRIRFLQVSVGFRGRRSGGILDLRLLVEGGEHDLRRARREGWAVAGEVEDFMED